MIFHKDNTLKIKKFLFRHRLVFLLFLGLITFSFLFIPAPAKAVLPVIGAVVGLAISVVQVIPIAVAIYAFIFIISRLFVSLAGWFLNVVTSPSFVSVSYTNPTGSNANLIIKAGLDITKNFVNLALVVILVYIAVAIALRLGETNARKLFARLIIVALLVNFAPVLVGLIVDASNIVMNYFLVGIKDGIANVLTQTSSWSDGIFQQIYGLLTFQTSIIARGLVMIILNFATGVALLLYAVIFLFRYIAIWTLVILSPLAFVAWILPNTKTFWDKWWSNLVQWSIIGIPMAFFLYLGARAYEALPTLFKTQMQTAGLEPEVVGLMNQTLPYFVVLVFLYLGFTVGLSTAATGAGAVIGWSRKAGAAIGSKIFRRTAFMAEEKGRIRERVGGVTKKLEEIPVARWLIPQAMRKYSEMRPAIEDARRKISIHGSPELGHKAAVSDIYGREAVAALLELVERGDSNDWFKEHLKALGYWKKHDLDDHPENYEKAVDDMHNDRKYQTKMARLLQIARSSGYHNVIVRGSPRLAEFAVDAGYAGYEDIPAELAKDPEFAKKSAEEKRAAIRKAAIQRAVDESRPKNIQNYEQEDVSNRDIIDAYMPRGRTEWQAIGGVKRGHLKPLEVIGDMFAEFAKKTKEELATASEKELQDAWKDFEENLKTQGKTGLFLYLDSPRAKEMGWTREEIVRLATKTETSPTGRRIELPKKKKGTKPGPAAGV